MKYVWGAFTWKFWFNRFRISWEVWEYLIYMQAKILSKEVVYWFSLHSNRWVQTQSVVLFLSNLELIEKRLYATNVVMTKNTTSMFTSTSVECPSRSSHPPNPSTQRELKICSERNRNVRWSINTRLSKAVRSNKKMSHTRSVCSYPENVMNIKIHQTSLYIGYLCTSHQFQRPTVNENEN